MTQEDYEKRIEQYKKRKLIIVSVVFLLIIISIFTITLIHYSSTYTKYGVENTVEKNDSIEAQYMKFGEGYVKCSKDGASAYTYSGNQIWNKSYEISNIKIDMNENYLAVADAESNEIYIFNTEKYLTTINTALPISYFCISLQGLVVAIVEDDKADYINMYDLDGMNLYSIKTTIAGEGTPVSVSLSEDGQKLIVALTAIENSQVVTSVVFYNFDEVGQNENERIVGGFDDYSESIVADVEFLTNTEVVAFADNSISFFKIKEYPSLVNKIEIDDKIKKVFYSEKYVGIVYNDKDDSELTKLSVFDLNGEKLLEQEVDNEYQTFKFTENCVLMYDDTKALLLTLSGKKKFEYTFEKGIVNLIPIEGDREYIYVNMDNIEKIKLK